MTHLKRRHMDVMDSDMIAEVGMYMYVKSLGQKVHKCDSCGKTYSQASILKKHINAVHNGIKDHKCGALGLALMNSHQFIEIKIKNSCIEFHILEWKN